MWTQSLRETEDIGAWNEVVHSASPMPLAHRPRQNARNPYDNFDVEGNPYDTCNEEGSLLGITIYYRDFIFPGVRSTYLPADINIEFSVMGAQLVKMGLGDIGDSGEHIYMAICGDMVNHGSGHTFNVCAIDCINGNNVCSQCSGSVSCDITASQVLVMDHHSWASSVSLGHERPPPEPPPGVRPPPEPPPMRHGI